MSKVISGTRTAEDVLQAYFNRVQPEEPLPPQPITTVAGGLITIDDLVNHKRIYGNLVEEGIPKALENAYVGVAPNGVVAGMPLLIAGKAKAPKTNYLWKNGFECLGGVYSGVDIQGKHTSRGEGLVMVVHNGCLWSDPDRVRKALAGELTNLGAGKLEPTEWNNFIDGKLPGKSIQLYTVDDIKQGRIPDPLFGNYGVVLPFSEAERTFSGRQNKSTFMANPFALAMAGTIEYLDDYFDKASSNDQLGSWHVFNDNSFNISQAQGRLLFLRYTDDGLYGYDHLDYYARFAGVVPSVEKSTSSNASAPAYGTGGAPVNTP